MRLLAALLFAALATLGAAGSARAGPTTTCPAGQLNCAISIQGVPVAASTPTDGQQLSFSAAAGAWIPGTPTASATSIAVGVTTIVGGTPGDCFFDNAGVLGNQPCGGGGGSVSITAGNGGVTISPSPLTGTGTVSLNITGGGAVSNEFVSAISAAGVATLTQPAYSNLSGGVAANDVMISGGPLANPTGLAPVNGDCMTGSGGVWAALPCPSGTTGGNPTAIIGTAAINGSATTFMRSDAAPAIPQCSASTFGACKVDGSTITASAGVISAVGGGFTAPTLSPGLATTPGTYNAGAQTLTSGSTLSRQLFYKAETTSCTLNSTCNSPSTNDSALLGTFTTASQTVTLPAPGAVGSATYQWGYDGSHSYSVTTPSGVINGGCGAAASTQSGIAYQTQFVSDGTNWQCVPSAAAVTVTTSTTQHGSAAVTLSATDQNVVTCNKSDSACTTGTWSAATPWTLPPSGSVSSGKTIRIYDDAQVISNAAPLTIQASAGDTVNLGSSISITSAAQGAQCTVDTTSKNWGCFPSIPNGASTQLLIGQGPSTPANWVTQSGDCTYNALGANTCTHLNGVAYPASPSTNTVPVVTASNTVTYEKVPNAALSTFIIPLSISWIPGQNPNNSIIATLNQSGTISSIVGTVETANGSTATVTVNLASSAVACSSGSPASTSFNANGTAATNQTITNGSISITAGQRLCLQTTGGSNWTSGAAAGGITVNFQPS